MPMQSLPQPDKPVTPHQSKSSEERPSQKGKPAPAAGRLSQRHKKSRKVDDPPGQVKSKNKKKNRLGQRARQQLGRAKEAGLHEGQPRKGSLVSCGSYVSIEAFIHVYNVDHGRLCVCIMHVGFHGPLQDCVGAVSIDM